MLLLTGVGSLRATTNIALVYENEGAVTQGKFFVSSLVPEGVLVSAQWALKAGGTILAGPVNGPLSHASLVRLDNDLDLAVLRLGEVVQNSQTQGWHKIKSKSIVDFLPNISDMSSVSIPSPSSNNSFPEGPLALKINGTMVGAAPILLKPNSLKKCKFKLEVVILSTTPVWGFSVELKSDPKLSFWKPGRTTTLNEVPRPVFTHDHQALFVPLKEGKSISIPVEAHFIDKEKIYTWTLSVKSKQGNLVQDVKIKFQ
ncbi:MAG: hypothetical protein KCHDKBKB_02922 [Elusimicrobia bacterium]|nr:hypothetical protein [Elusimicrobiota bacterium]